MIRIRITCDPTDTTHPLDQVHDCEVFADAGVLDWLGAICEDSKEKTRRITTGPAVSNMVT